jgi:hypothetical protein
LAAALRAESCLRREDELVHGWIAKRAWPAKLFTGAIAVGYGTLGIFGSFSDGLLMGSPLRIPLEAADNVFHLVVGAAAALTVAVAVAVRRPR